MASRALARRFSRIQLEGKAGGGPSDPVNQIQEFVQQTGGLQRISDKDLLAKIEFFEKISAEQKAARGAPSKSPPSTGAPPPSAVPPPPIPPPTGGEGAGDIGGGPPLGGAVEALQPQGGDVGGGAPVSQFQVGALSALRSTLGRRNPPISTRVLQGRLF